MGLFIISFLTFSYSSGNLVAKDVMTGFYFSDHIVPNEEIVWDIAKFDTEGVPAEWPLKTGYTAVEGDQIKIKVTKDPDELNISHYGELFYSDVDWAEFYLNDAYLSDNPSDLDLTLNLTDEILMAWLFILPTTIEFDTGNESLFEYFYDMMTPYTYSNDSGIFEVSLTSDLFTQKLQIEYEYALLFLPGIFRVKQTIEMSYNIVTGVLDKLDVYAFASSSESTNEAHIILLNEDSTQKVSIHWATGFIALLTIGLAVGYMRKR